MLHVIYYTFLFPFFSSFLSFSARKSGYKVQPIQELVALGMSYTTCCEKYLINAISVDLTGLDK